MTKPTKPPAPPLYRYMGAVALDEFSHSGKTGTRVEYYRGFMAEDLDISPQNSKDMERMNAGETRDTAWILARNGRLLLTQKRHGVRDYSYYATKASSK